MTPGPFDPIGSLGDDAGESLGAMLARVRAERGKSQLRLAEQLCAAAGVPTVTRNEISRWEREERIPTATWLRWLAVVLDVPLDDLELAAARARSRRTSRAPARVIGVGLPDLPPFDRAARPLVAGRPASAAPTGTGPSIAELRRMDDLVGGADLLPVVTRELTAAVAAARRTDRPAGRPRLALIADLAQLTGWVAADAGAPATMLAAHRIGMRAARAVADWPLTGHLLGSLAQLTAESGDPHRALRLARLARGRAAPMSSATTRALQWHRVAFAAARAGERRACEEALTTAVRAYGRRDAASDPGWLYWFDEAHLAAMTGRCYAALGRPHLARPLLAAALDSGRLQPRAYAVHACWLAQVRADARDLDAAAALAGSALLNAVRTGSVRAARHVRALDDRLLVRSSDPAVRAYAELAAAARAYLPGGPMPPGAARASCDR